MNRRGFLGTLLGAAATVASAPLLPDIKRPSLRARIRQRLVMLPVKMTKWIDHGDIIPDDPTYHIEEYVEWEDIGENDY